MDMSPRMRGSLGIAFATLCSVATSGASAQWTVAMRAMNNPLAVGQCTAIEVVPKDGNGTTPLRPNGSQLDWQDFELSISGAPPDAFAWSNERHRFLCARAPTAPSVTVTAHYPGSQLKPNQIVPGVNLSQSIEVLMQGVPPAPVATAAPEMPPVQPAPGYGPGGVPAAGAPPPTSGYPGDPGTPPAQPAPGYPAPTDPGYPGAAPGLAAQPGEVRTATNGKQFVEKVTSHAKQKAKEVAAHTVDYTADAANDIVDTTLEAGSQVVKSNVQSTAGGVGQAGKSLVTGGEETEDPKDLTTALAKGRVVLRHLRFQEHTAVLDPSTGPVITQLSQAMLAAQGQFLIEGHVEKSEGEQAQALSEQRAAAVKAALISAGVSPAQLVAAGYGATRPLGKGGSARIEIAHTQ